MIEQKSDKIRQKKHKKIILLDAGHGGIIEGEYQTAGKRAYFKNETLMSSDLSLEYREQNCDIKYYEGVGNRDIRTLIAEGLKKAEIDYRFINTTNRDMSLSTRCNIANDFCKTFGTSNCIFISIHSNGFHKESAHGYSFYTSIGESMSDKYAEILYQEAEKMFPDERARTDRTDGDLDKEANFKVLRSTRCPAILGEMFFHTNYFECVNYLLSDAGKQKIADTYINAIKRMIG